jgi:hypothetical protein
VDEPTKNRFASLSRAAITALWALRGIVRTAWSIIRAPLIHALILVLAVVIIFEEWGYRPLVALLGWLASFAPLARLEKFIASLPPYAALAVFALPTTLLLPLKFVAMWLLANGHVASATGLFVGAKVASTALIARVFMLTKPALMRISWFARAYNWFMPWKEALFAEIRASWVWRYGRMVKNRIKLEAKQAWARLRPRFEAWLSTAPPFLRETIEAIRNGARTLREKAFGPSSGEARH